LKPEYNILKIAGSRLGTKQSEKTKKLISNASRIHRHSEETKEKIRVANTGRKHTEATKLKMSANRLSHTLRVINNKTGEIKIFTSIRLTAEILGIHRPSLIICLRKNKIYIGKGFTITRV
jgi:group I intron endonuclease